ncbi:MAG: hypothetical protein EOP01_04085, partial [Propionibacteriaceae bacterium]
EQLFQPIEEGADHVPDEGGAILASNHLSYADWLFTPLALNRRVTFVAKSDYFTGVGVKGWAQKRFFAGTGQVPVGAGDAERAGRVDRDDVGRPGGGVGPARPHVLLPGSGGATRPWPGRATSTTSTSRPSLRAAFTPVAYAST